MRFYIFGGIAVLLLAVAAGLLVYHLLVGDNQARIDSFRQNCAEAGGHIYGIDVIFCITEDGRFIEVYP